MGNLDVHFSSKKMDWTTPQAFYEELHKEFHFTLDAAASKENTKCPKYFTEENSALVQSWKGETVFCNPPYGNELKKFVEKAYQEHKEHGNTIVLLVPARTDTRYFHDFIYGKAEIRFIKGRLKFSDGKSSAPFPSMVVIYR